MIDERIWQEKSLKESGSAKQMARQPAKFVEGSGARRFAAMMFFTSDGKVSISPTVSDTINGSYHHYSDCFSARSSMHSSRFRTQRNRFHAIFIGIVLALSNVAQGDVYQWEFVDPANPALGKRKSATLAPEGTGANFDSVLGLYGRDLTKAYLYRASVNGYRLSSTILNDAYLAEASMYNVQADGTVARGADLSRANLEFSRLVNADLTGANFAGANLSRAHLSSAVLAGSHFSGANITGAQLDGTIAKGFTIAQLYQTASYQQRNLGSISLSSNNLSGWDFTGQRMENSQFDATNLTNAVFLDAVITGASFASSNLASTQLYETNNYKNRQLNELRFERMNLAGWTFADQSLLRTRFSETPLSGADFDRADLTNAFFSGGLTHVQSDVSFRGAKLTSATFDTNGRWQRADLTGANLENARLSNNFFENSDFTDAIIRGAEMRYIVGITGFTLENLYSTASYKSGDLTDVEIDFGELPNANFANVDFSRARLANLQLDGADFRGANLTDATIGASLNGADFSGANLTNAHVFYDRATSINFRGANLTGAGSNGRRWAAPTSPTPSSMAHDSPWRIVRRILPQRNSTQPPVTRLDCSGR